MPFYSGGVNLNDFFFTDRDIVDRYVNSTILMDGIYPFGSFGQVGNGLPNASTGVTIGNDWSNALLTSLSGVGIKTDGTIWTWGYGQFGQLGDGTNISKSSPVQIAVGGSNWSKIACGDNNVSAIKSDGTLWTWGRAFYGALGRPTAFGDTPGNYPAQTTAGGTTWSQVDNGQFHTAAIKTDGTL
jgi:hypothetical protein